MASATVYVSNEKFNPLPSVAIECFDLTTGAILATATSARTGLAIFSSITTPNPYFFRPRITRNSGGMSEHKTMGVIRLHRIA